MTDQTQTTEEYKKQVVAWLRRREMKWRQTAQLVPGAAGDAATFYAAAYMAAADGVSAGEPEKRAFIEASS